MAKPQSFGKKQPMAEINVTPLVDVMLVLLIVFMITAPMTHNNLEVNLPKTGIMKNPSVSHQTIVTISASKDLYVNNEHIAFNKLSSEVIKVQKNHADKGVILEADQSVRYGFITFVLSELKKAGIEQVSLATESISEKP
jgi:biopolymer transport protein ExbD